MKKQWLNFENLRARKCSESFFFFCSKDFHNNLRIGILTSFYHVSCLPVYMTGPYRFFHKDPFFVCIFDLFIIYHDSTGTVRNNKHCILRTYVATTNTEASRRCATVNASSFWELSITYCNTQWQVIVLRPYMTNLQNNNIVDEEKHI